jgi:ribosomal protein L12E/L44/L45/RPP1/RPP2
MKFIAVHLLAHLGDSAAEAGPPSKDDVWRILESIGAAVEEDQLDLLFTELEGKDVAERGRLAYAPCAGAVGVGSCRRGCWCGGQGGGEEGREKDGGGGGDEGMGFSLFDD